MAPRDGLSIRTTRYPLEVYETLRAQTQELENVLPVALKVLRTQTIASVHE